MENWNETAALLLRHARRILEDLVAGRDPAPVPAEGGLAARAGLCVGIRDAAGELRGWMGTTAADEPLWTLLPALVRTAAFDDPRFPPLSAAELEGATLSVTIVLEGRRITGPGELEIGVDAVAVQQGIFTGLTVPEVAWGRGWDAPTYLAFACRKAGLPALAWQRADTVIRAFPTVSALEN